jgi:hypothetical protein
MRGEAFDAAGACRRRPLRRMSIMILLLAFIVAAVVGQAVNVAICIVIDKVAPGISFMVFFALYMGVFWLAWRIAVFVTEKEFMDAVRRRFAGSGAS